MRYLKIIAKTISNRFKFWKMENKWTFLYGAVAQDRLSVHFKVVQIIPKSVSNHFKSWQNHVEIISQPFQVLRNQKHKKLSSMKLSLKIGFAFIFMSSKLFRKHFKLFSIISKSDWNFFQSFQILANWKHKKLSSMIFCSKHASRSF